MITATNPNCLGFNTAAGRPVLHAYRERVTVSRTFADDGGHETVHWTLSGQPFLSFDLAIRLLRRATKIPPGIMAALARREGQESVLDILHRIRRNAGQARRQAIQALIELVEAAQEVAEQITARAAIRREESPLRRRWGRGS